MCARWFRQGCGVVWSKAQGANKPGWKEKAVRVWGKARHQRQDIWFSDIPSTAQRTSSEKPALTKQWCLGTRESWGPHELPSLGRIRVDECLFIQILSEKTEFSDRNNLRTPLSRELTRFGEHVKKVKLRPQCKKAGYCSPEPIFSCEDWIGTWIMAHQFPGCFCTESLRIK